MVVLLLMFTRLDILYCPHREFYLWLLYLLGSIYVKQSSQGMGWISEAGEWNYTTSKKSLETIG